MRALYFIILLSFTAHNLVFAADTRTAYIEAPNPCHVVDRVEKENVYLKPTKDACAQVISKIPVNIDSSVKKVLVYIGSHFYKEQEVVYDFNIDAVDGVLKSKEGYKKSISLPENNFKKEMSEAAQKTFNSLNSEEHTKKVDAEKEKIKELLHKTDNISNTDPLSAKKGDAKKSDKKRVLSSSERLYIFISSSMPVHTTRHYMAAVDEMKDPNIIFVMRGFIDGMKYVKPTMKFASEILLKDPFCDILTNPQCPTYSPGFIIDPLLFRKYNITSVPSFVYAPNINILDHVLSEGLAGNATASEFYAVYGDAALEYNLNLLKKVKDSKKSDTEVTGAVYKIAENDALQEIEQRAASVDWGKYISKAKYTEQVKRYKPENLMPLPSVHENSSHTVDMTATLDFDIPDDKGNIIYPKGFSFNPLDYVSLPKVLVVIDGNNSKQIEWFKQSKYSKDINTMLFLVDGSYADVAAQVNRPVFYATKPILERFKIKAVPSVIRQKGKTLEVFEDASYRDQSKKSK